MNAQARRWLIGGVVGVALLGSAGLVTARAAAAPVNSGRHFTYYAFDINGTAQDPGFIPVAGTNPARLSQGDEKIINDQITTTHKTGGGYPIVGYDAGVCTLTRIPEPNAEETYAQCDATLVVASGSLTVQGTVSFNSQGQPQPTVLAVTGGTGDFTGAIGTLRVSFLTSHKVLTFALR